MARTAGRSTSDKYLNCVSGFPAAFTLQPYALNSYTIYFDDHLNLTIRSRSRILFALTKRNDFATLPAYPHAFASSRGKNATSAAVPLGVSPQCTLLCPGSRRCSFGPKRILPQYGRSLRYLSGWSSGVVGYHAYFFCTNAELSLCRSGESNHSRLATGYFPAHV